MKENLSNLSLANEVKTLIEQSKQQVSVAVNATMSMLYWQIGLRINQDILQNQRAEYGKRVVSALSLQLKIDYGIGWSEKHLRHCVRFAEVFPDAQIVSTLWRQLSWSHFKEIIYFDDELKRTFYIEICKIEKWSVRTFRQRINSMLYERTAISKKPEEAIKTNCEHLPKRTN